MVAVPYMPNLNSLIWGKGHVALFFEWNVWRYARPWPCFLSPFCSCFYLFTCPCFLSLHGLVLWVASTQMYSLSFMNHILSTSTPLTHIPMNLLGTLGGQTLHIWQYDCQGDSMHSLPCVISLTPLFLLFSNVWKRLCWSFLVLKSCMYFDSQFDIA